VIQNRFLYHCFPRRGASSAGEIEKGLKILTCIRDFGLLLLPESIEWSQPVNNKPPRTFPVVQPRICFTDLAPVELSEHAEKFGRFALEFEVEVARQLGAVPVFYVPQRGGGLGTSLVAILLDARAVIDRAALLHKVLKENDPEIERLDVTTGFARNPQDKKTFNIHSVESKVLLEALNHQATPWPMLSQGFDALMGFFYPADNTVHDKPLQYYQQREWRIACNFAINGVDVLRRPSEDEARRISEIEPQFFLRPVQTDHGAVERLSRSLIHPGLDGKTILQLAKKLIAPESAIDQIREAIKDVEGSPEIVAIENLR
jgi:hypothetical protein